MPSSHGMKRKSRSILTKSNIARGLSYLLVDYKVGDKVIVNIDPREQSTMPHRRFQGKVGIIMDVGRRTLKIAIKIGQKQKILQTKLNHIKPIATSQKDGRTD